MRWAALLRAINAGVRLPMADLRTFLADQGMRDVATLLASGNAVFTADEDDGAALEARLHAAMRDKMGIETGWFLRSHADLNAIVAANPFPDAAEMRPNLLLVYFCREAVDPAQVQALATTIDGPERLRAIGRELYIDHVVNVGKSKLPQAMAKARLAVGATARNWNTVRKLAELTAPATGG